MIREGRVAVCQSLSGTGALRIAAEFIKAGLDLEDSSELKFVYSRERLNVAVMRAKRKCVMLCSPAVLSAGDGQHLQMAVVETAEMRAG